MARAVPVLVTVTLLTFVDLMVSKSVVHSVVVSCNVTAETTVVPAVFVEVVVAWIVEVVVVESFNVLIIVETWV